MILKKLWVVGLATGGLLLVFGLVIIAFASRPPMPPTVLGEVLGVAENGEYLTRISGCVACHTDTKNKGKLLAGGAAIESPYGTFYAPNITPDTEFGIGGWSLEDLYTALKKGVSPSGQHYYPAFPYPSYQRLSIDDIVDIKAYLDSVAPVQQQNKPQALLWPVSMRPLLAFWKALFARSTLLSVNVSEASPQSGEYLVRGLGHCAECHSQRNLLGAIGPDQTLLGNSRGPDGHSVPALMGDQAEIQNWDKSDIVFYLQTGMRPDGDIVGGSMAEVINEGTAHLRQNDAEAIADYLLSLP